MLVTFPYNPYPYLQKAFSLNFLKTVVAFCVCYATSALAHPHIFIDLKVSASNDKVTITWAFDAMTSAMLIGDYDKNKDKVLDASEIAFIETDHFRPLAPYSYFMRFFDGKEELEVQKVDSFSASIDKKRLVYTFSLPSILLKKYELRFFDPEMYVALILKKEGLSCSKEFTCKASGYDADFYYAYKASISR